jgi:hypothetical protein
MYLEHLLFQKDIPHTAGLCRRPLPHFLHSNNLSQTPSEI